ncbi:MAG: outer membrane protein assembly factor BamB family protein [Armatimonadota bacterium]
MIFRRAGLMAAILVLASSTAFSADCIMGRYEPDQCGFTPEKLELPIALNWEFTASKFDNNPASPVVAAGVCYFASGSNVYAIDMATGSKKWQYPADQPLAGSIKGTPAVYNGNVYFTSVDGNMYCVDAQSGVFQWAFQTRGPIRCSPAIDDGTIFIAADDNSVYAIDADTGDSAWSSPVTARDDFAQGLAVGSGIIVVACMDGNLYGINQSSGKPKWKFRLSQAPVRTSPIISNSLAIMAIGDAVYGLPVRSGQLKWLINLPSEAAATPASSGQDIYIPCRDKKLYAYTLTGRQPALKWTEPVDLGATPMSSPIIADDTLYIASSKGVVAAYSTVDGSLKWRYIAAPSQVNTPGVSFTDASSSPTVANKSMLLLTDDGVLHCFSPDAPDNVPPMDFKLVPTNGTAMSGVPPIKMSAIVYDTGSGVDFSTVTLSLDGNSLAYKTDPATSTISYDTEVGEDGKSVRKLNDGVHTITLNAKDYVGNTLTKEWFFFADNSLPPPKRAVPADPGKKTKESPSNQRRPSRGFGGPSLPGGNNNGGVDIPPPPPPPMPAPPSVSRDASIAPPMTIDQPAAD